VGGAERQANLVACGLRALGHDVHYVTSRRRGWPGGLKTASLDPQEVAEASARGADVIYVRDVLAVRKALELGRLRGSVPVVVALYSGTQCTLLSRRQLATYLRGQGAKAMVNYPLNRVPEFASTRVASRLAACVVAQTAEQSRLLRQNFGRSATIIPNGYDLSQCSPSVAPAARRYVTWIGKAYKRPDRFIRAAAALGPMDDVEYIMLGVEASQLPAGLARLAESHGVRLAGEAPHERVDCVVGQSLVYVHTAEYEGFPNTFLEAWAHEVPVVSAGVDPDGVLSTTGSGVVCTGLEEMVRVLRELLADPDRRTEAGRAGRQHLVATHDLAITSRAHELLFRRLVDSRSAGRG